MLAQENSVSTSIAKAQLPDAPLPSQDDSTKDVRTDLATVSGAVVDADGAALADASVSLFLNDGKLFGTLKSNSNGQFTFIHVPAGSYFVAIDATGFNSFKTTDFTVAMQQVYTVPDIKLGVASVATTVSVRPTEEIAAEQIKAEERQRLLGIVPNYYVSYIHDAAPLTSKQKLSLAVHDTFDWTTYIGVSVGAGIEQATNAYSGYGQGAEGYAKRWGALFANGRTSDLFSHYVFASLLHQDPRYFYQGTGTPQSRLLHALSNGFVARSDSGKTMPNYSYLLGDLCSAALANAYYPSTDRGASLVFSTAAIGIAGRALQGVAQEFLAKHITRHAADSGSQGNSPSTTPTNNSGQSKDGPGAGD